ncbi:MAG: hypothetical protein AB2552_05910 [Candidatus Thiodiazotropha endolucinida]
MEKKQVYKMDSISRDNIPKSLDCFIIAAGADYRSYVNLEKLVASGCKINKLIIYDFKQRQSTEDQEYANAYNKYSEIYSEETVLIESDITQPTTCVPNLTKNNIICPTEKIGLDISCFTKPYFFVLLKYLSHIKIKLIHVFYTQPRAYRFTSASYCSYKSSSGPISVREIPSFPGSESRQPERMLVVFLGFDGDLSTEISEIVAPTKIVLVNGFPSFEAKYKDISLINNEKLINASGKLLYSKSSNPFDTYNTLAKLASDYQNATLNIAPLGNKPMALGACLFAIHNPNVRIIYPYPESYVNITTDKCSLSWMYTLPLQDLA